MPTKVTVSLMQELYANAICFAWGGLFCAHYEHGHFHFIMGANKFGVLASPTPADVLFCDLVLLQYSRVSVTACSEW